MVMLLSYWDNLVGYMEGLPEHLKEGIVTISNVHTYIMTAYLATVMLSTIL